MMQGGVRYTRESGTGKLLRGTGWLMLVIWCLMAWIVVSARMSHAEPRLHPPPYHPEKYLTMTHDGRERSFMLFVPSCHTRGNPIPLLLVLHGGGGTGEAVEIQTSMNRKAEQECFIAVYPNAVSILGAAGRQQIWNAGPRKGVRNPGTDDVGFIAALLDRLQREYAVDRARVYATGISNGAMMSYRLACQLSDRIAAIAPVAGGMIQPDCRPAHPVSVIHFHGTADPGWPYDGGASCYVRDFFPPVAEIIEKWVAFNRCGEKPRVAFHRGDATCVTYEGCGDRTEVTLCTIRGGGHTWPGGYAFPSEQAIPFDDDCPFGRGRGVGRITRDLSAVDAMWEFFTRHPRASGPSRRTELQ